MSVDMLQQKPLVGLDPDDPVVKRLLAAVEDQLTVKEVTESLAQVLGAVDGDISDERAFAELILAELAQHGLAIVRG